MTRLIEIPRNGILLARWPIDPGEDWVGIVIVGSGNWSITEALQYTSFRWTNSS